MRPETSLSAAWFKTVSTVSKFGDQFSLFILRQDLIMIGRGNEFINQVKVTKFSLADNRLGTS